MRTNAVCGGLSLLAIACSPEPFAVGYSGPGPDCDSSIGQALADGVGGALSKTKSAGCTLDVPTMVGSRETLVLDCGNQTGVRAHVDPPSIARVVNDVHRLCCSKVNGCSQWGQRSSRECADAGGQVGVWQVDIDALAVGDATLVFDIGGRELGRSAFHVRDAESVELRVGEATSGAEVTVLRDEPVTYIASARDENGAYLRASSGIELSVDDVRRLAFCPTFATVGTASTTEDMGWGSFSANLCGISTGTTAVRARTPTMSASIVVHVR